VRDAQGNPMDGDGYEWSGSYFGDSGFLWNDCTAASVNAWVDQE
jgi:hypothetical protein